MIRLLAPAGLLGLLALALPAVLHLRRPPPPTVRVGSLRHLAAVSGRRRRWWQWRDRLRLALRLALLALLALALAGPSWQGRNAPRPVRWSLVDPAAGTLTGSFRERLDDRRKAGDVVRQLADGFPEPRAGNAADPSPADVWSLLRELDARLPAGSSLTVFSPARLDSLRGERPTLGNVTVDWVETPAVPVERKVIPGDPGVPPVRVVILHAADRAGDARRLAEAAGALAPAVAVTVADPGAGTGPPAPDWLFCLGSERPEALPGFAGVAGTRNLFTDAGEAMPTDDEGDVVVPAGLLVAPELAGGPDLLVRRRVALPDDPAAATLWTDDVGRPLLTLAVTAAAPNDRVAARRRRWRFASRFDPAWNDLAANPGALTAALRAWVLPGPDRSPDERVAGGEQARPRAGAATGERAGWPWQPDRLDHFVTDLRPWVLALAAAGFLLERFWALRRFRPAPRR